MSIIVRGKKVEQKCIDRFWERVAIRSKNKCWEWQAGLNSKKPGYNYGLFYVNKGSTLAHRLALSFHQNKLVNSKMEVMHTCDNPLCCNPYHLLEGTHKENMQDMNRKNRRTCEKGEKRYNAKLNDKKVKEMRVLFKNYEKYKKDNITYLAKKYGVTTNVIRLVVNHKGWKHVEDLDGQG